MNIPCSRASGLALVAALAAGRRAAAWRTTRSLAKFDDTKPITLNGIVTLVDWRNPHVHVFMNVQDAQGQLVNWAVELESPIDLQQSGWTRDTLQPGDAITVQGIAARNGSRQVWGRSIVMTATGKAGAERARRDAAAGAAAAAADAALARRPAAARRRCPAARRLLGVSERHGARRERREGRRWTRTAC